MKESNKRILLGMSGGVDSSAAAILLSKQGYEVIGLTIDMWKNPEDDPRHSDHNSTVLEAKAVAQQLEIEHYSIKVHEEFECTVIKNFLNEYQSGRTPNPCVVCNREIKWKYLLIEAEKHNCDFIASGHYARIKKHGNNFFIRKAKDQKKDQSYFLWNLPKNILKKIIFPLGDYEKKEVKQIAHMNGFTSLSQKKESQEICFIHDNDYRKFINQNVPDTTPVQGNFILENGKIVGKHKGISFYTLGQRKGLNVALGEPMYVKKIDTETNEITLVPREGAYESKLTAKNINLFLSLDDHKKYSVKTKIRYKSHESQSKIIKEKDTLHVEFKEKVFAITPGQSAVFYRDDLVIGGGIIE